MVETAAAAETEASPVRQRGAARKETPPPRPFPQRDAQQGLPHVPKSSFKGVSCHKCVASEQETFPCS